MRELQYGAEREGYWSYEDMILQVEDCVDCFWALHGGKYNYLFIFDHSNGHDCMASDALSVLSICKNDGGSQPFMKSLVIKDTSFLGPFQHDQKLQVGDTQKMHFTNTDHGPFYMSSEEREGHKYIEIIGTKTDKLTIPDLVNALKEKGIKDPKGSKKKLQQLCQKNNIQITYEIADIKEGWMHKQKGAFQILYERGWIDPAQNPKDYSMLGMIDMYGN